MPAIVLDPFLGSGTTSAVSRRLGRRAIGIELSGEYIKLAEKRIKESALPLLEAIEANEVESQLEPEERNPQAHLPGVA